jgi:hypothetical protein
MSFETASFCITTPLPAFLDVFEAVLETTFWNAAELFCYGLLNGRNIGMAKAVQMLVSVVGIRKKKSQND